MARPGGGRGGGRGGGLLRRRELNLNLRRILTPADLAPSFPPPHSSSSLSESSFRAYILCSVYWHGILSDSTLGCHGQD